MKLKGFIGPAYQLESVNVDAQRCVNLYPRIIESGAGKEGQVAYLKATPGLEELCEVGAGPIRLIHIDTAGRIFVVSGNKLYYVTESAGTWSAAEVGSDGIDGGSTFTLSTTTGPIRAASMSFQNLGTDSSTVFVDGVANYLYKDEALADTFGLLSTAGYGPVLTATHIEWIDGYFVLTEGGTNKFRVSDLAGLDIDELSFASAEGDPDLLLALLKCDRNLWLFGEKTTEVFVNTGNSDMPFERVSGGFIEQGILAPYSAAKINNTVIWLGRNDSGQGVIYAAQGLSPQRVSTGAIETAIASYTAESRENAKAFAYQSLGHAFYVLSFEETTWVYDLSTQLWHERAYFSGGEFERHRADVHAFDSGHGYHLVGDYETNQLYRLNDDYYSDAGDAIKRLRSAPHTSAEGRKVFCSRLNIDMETGVGLASGQGSDPQVVMDFSNDGGHTWSSESWASAGGQVGGIGAYTTRVYWNRLGSFRDRVFRVSITDPVKVVFIDAFIDVVGGNH